MPRLSRTRVTLTILLGLPFGLSAQPDAALKILNQNCASCHGASQQLSGYDLRTREGAVKGGLRGAAIVPGNADSSALFRRLTGAEKPVMPLGGKLKDDDVAVIRKWIEDGAKWPEAGVVISGPVRRAITQEDRNWWAFRKPVRREPPQPSTNPIDGFVSAKLVEKGLTTVPRADKWTLARRAFLDLTGLPPSAEEVDAFIRDESPDAYAKLVDRLLASPRYGERWGRHWLDAARYADSGGYEHDYTYPNAWRYRDYVIRAFNQDKPYDRFIREQIAGDELDDADYDALIATGFQRVGATVGFREKDNPQFRFTYLDDMIGVTSRVFLGLTVNCARCHDHKFDPIPQKDYYKLVAVFFPHINYDHPLAPAAEVAAYEAKKKEVEAKIEPLKAKVRTIEAPYRKQAFDQSLNNFPEDIQIAVRTPPEKRTEGQKLLATQVETIRPATYRSLMTAEVRSEVDRLGKEIKALESQFPKPLPVAMGIRDGDYRLAPLGLGDDEAPGKGVKIGNEDLNETYVPVAGKPYRPPKSYMLEMGDYTARGAEVQPGFLEVISDLGVPTSIQPADGRITTGRRRALAEWIASKDNPLTARVMANRIWQHHFGHGLVTTASNFGRMGTNPSHPELLDWLATEFMRSGWSVKQMHRIIMNSQTYQRASEFQSDKDPENIYLAHYPLRRLEGEAIRDMILAVSGNLNLKAGGPSYFPPVPESVRKSIPYGEWAINEEGPEVWRRGVYSFYSRGMKYPMFEVFDQPDPNVTCERRGVSTAPTQALTLLNNDFVLGQAKAFAERVWKLAGPEQQNQVRTAFRIALGREPSAKQIADNVAFLNRRIAAQGSAPSAGLEALTDLCDVILNLNEFLYIN